jgi:rRNA small subunit pseudouridine methyltransferase Nep1
MKRLRPIDDNNQSKLQIGLKSKVSIKKSNLNDKTKSSLILPQKNEKELDKDNDDNEEEEDDDDNNNDDMTGLSKPMHSSKQITSSSSTVSDLKTTRPISGGAVTLGDASDSKTATATVTLVLEQASLESVKTKRGFELMNCDEHGTMLKKAKRDPAESRPDILHQLLLCALDSPLNKAGHLRILVQSKTGVLIEISPHTRIPRTFKRFAGLMVQLLHKMRVRAADGSDTLLKVIKNPVTSHLPIGATVVGLEMGSRLVDAFDLPALLPPKKPVVFVIGAMSHGNIEADYITQTFSVSRYPLSAACALGKLLNAFEHFLSIL